MVLISVLIPVTLLVVVGFFVLAAAEKAEGTVKSFGKYLAIWVFVLAAVVVIGIASAPMFGGRPFGMEMRGSGMPGMMMGGGMMGGGMMRPPSGPEPTPVAPAPPGQPSQGPNETPAN